MRFPSKLRNPRASRWPVLAVITTVGLGMAGAGIMPAEPDVTGSYVEVGAPTAGLPAGTLTTRSTDGPTADRGPAGQRRATGWSVAQSSQRNPDPARSTRPAPEDAAERALERAGRLSAPCTAPPVLS